MSYNHHAIIEDDILERQILEFVAKIGIKIAYGWSKKNRHHRDDMVSVMHLTVVETVNRYPALLATNEDAVKYMARAIKHACMDYALAIPPVHAPSASARRAIELGLPPAQFLQEEAIEVAASADIDEDDILFTLARTEQERYIIAQRLEGKTYREIGEELNLTKARVQQITTSLRHRLWE